MEHIDVRFAKEELAIIKNMVGDRLVKYKCDPFEFSTAVYGIVGICTDRMTCAFTNMIKTMDYFGADEDVADFRIARCEETELKSLIPDTTMIEMPVNRMIKAIDVVNEHQRLFEHEKQIYDVWVTRGVVFHLEDDSEIALEKNVWFSEMITVDRGEHLLEKFSPVEEFNENWEGSYRGECLREVVTFN